VGRNVFLPAKVEEISSLERTNNWGLKLNEFFFHCRVPYQVCISLVLIELDPSRLNPEALRSLHDLNV